MQSRPEPAARTANNEAHIRQRRLALATYATSVALTSVAYIGTFQNASVAAPHMTGTAATGGLPSSMAVAGTAVAAAVLSSVMASRGRRTGVMAGIGVAVGGGILCVLAALVASFPILLAGAGLLGFGNAAVALSRYAAADMYPAASRAAAVGIVVWGSTVGAVAGPNLVGPANEVGIGLDLPRFTGGFILALAVLGVAVLVATFGPRAPADPEAPSPGTAPTIARTPVRQLLGALLSEASGRTAVLALVSGQLVMVLIMTMTPYQLDHTGHTEQVIGFVISAHVFGMFALSPVSGRLTQTLGPMPVILLGFGLLSLAGLLGAIVPERTGGALMIPLFLLGFGWNLGFVAGSSLLASGHAFADRARLQGVIDAAVWGMAAFAGVAAGFVVEFASYAVLCVAGAVLAVLLAGAIAVDGRAVRAAAT